MESVATCSSANRRVSGGISAGCATRGTVLLRHTVAIELKGDTEARSQILARLFVKPDRYG
jgi:hypothetical protein